MEYVTEKFQPYYWKYSYMMRKIALKWGKIGILVEDKINGVGRQLKLIEEFYPR